MNDFLQSLRNGQADKPRTPKTRKNYDNSYQYSNNPRFPSYGNGYQNTRNPNMKRQPMPAGPMGNQMPQEDPGMTMLADAIENLTNHVEILVKNQEYLTTIQERTADMMERQAFAIERIVTHLSLDSAAQTDTPAAYENHDETSQESQKFVDTVQADPYRSADAMDQPAPRKDRQKADADFFPENILTPADPEQTTKRRVIRKRKKAAPATKTTSAASTNTALLPREEVMNIIQTMRKQNATYDQIAKHLVGLGQPTFSGRGEWHAQTIHRLCSKK
jgi:hypothetical protein